MLNQVVLVGRLTETPEVKELEDGKKVVNITLAVPRSYKNEEGVYDTDFIPCELWNSIASNTAEYCKKGDMVGVKGRIQMDSFENKDGNKQIKMKIQTEKVTFLATGKENREHDDNER